MDKETDLMKHNEQVYLNKLDISLFYYLSDC